MLRSGLPVGVKVAVAFGKSEHGDDVPADSVPADRPQSFESFEESVDVCDCHVRDVALNTVCEPLQASLAVPDINVAYPTAASGFDELVGCLGDRSDGEQVDSIRSVEPDDIGECNFSGSFSGAGPLVHCGGEADAEFLGFPLTVAKELKFPFGHLVTGAPPVRQSDCGLLSDQAGFLHAGEVANLSLATFLPIEGEHRVAVLAIDGVDLDSRGTGSDLHDTAAFAFSGHRTRSPCQVCWNSFWNSCRGPFIIVTIS